MDTLGTLGSIVLVSVATASITVATYVTLRLKKRRYDSYFFGLMSLSIALWASGLYLRGLALEQGLSDWLDPLTRIIFASSSLMNSSLLLFAMSFPDELISKKKRNKKLLTIVTTIGVSTFFFILFREEIIREYSTQLTPEGRFVGVTYGPFGGIIQLYYLLTGILTLGVLLLKKRQNKGKTSKVEQVNYALIGFSISAFGIVVPNLALPLIGITTFNWLGPLFSLAMIGFIGAAVLRLNLWDTKLVLSEILLGSMGVIITVFLFLSSSWVELLLNLTTLIIFLVLASILLREVLSGLSRTNKLRRANKKLTETIEAKDNFLRMTSHQLRTPLTSLNGFLSMVVDKDNKEYSLDQKSYHDVIKVYINSQRLASVVNDILTVNAINAGRFGLNIRKDEDVEFIVQMILLERKSLIEYYERDIEYRKKGEKFIADIDPTRFREIIQNLIDNAVIYAKKNILVELVDMPHDIRVIITDDGIGFTPYEKRKMSDRSYRGKEAIARHPNGSGMGLFIVETIVKAHGGSFKVHSEGRGQGTVIIVELPKKQKE